jgi:hypothetical protein
MARQTGNNSDHFLQADFPVLIRPTSSNAVSGELSVGRRSGRYSRVREHNHYNNARYF